MKKIILATFLLAALSLLCSCFNTELSEELNNDTSADTKTSETVFNAVIETTAASADRPEEADASYTVSYERYFENTESYRLNVLYPVFSDCENAQKLSKTVYDYSLSYMQNYITYENPGEGLFNCSVNDVILTYESDRFASFKCIGSCYFEGASHDNEFTYTINIEIETGKLLGFEDIITEFDELAQIYKSGVFSLITTGNPNLDAELSKLSYEDLINQYSSLYEIYPPLYFVSEEDSTSLVLSLEQVYALGSRADFRADTANLRSVLTEEISALLFD